MAQYSPETGRGRITEFARAHGTTEVTPEEIYFLAKQVCDQAIRGIPDDYEEFVKLTRQLRDSAQALKDAAQSSPARKNVKTLNAHRPQIAAGRKLCV